jgi:deoxyxylulose-5-phosphate synthase
MHGLPDKFIEHGKPAELYEMLKMDGKGIADIVKEILMKKTFKEVE